MANKQAVRIECQGAETIYIEKLVHFQGELKTLSEAAEAKLRTEILADGFSEPISVWRDRGKNYVLNGHQRLHVLTKLKAEGWEIPPLPISLVKAKDKRHALRKVLALTSQYGKITGPGLKRLMEDADLEFGDLAEAMQFAEVDLDDFFSTYFADEESGDEGASEVPESAYRGFKMHCPRCGFGFDKPTDAKAEDVGHGAGTPAAEAAHVDEAPPQAKPKRPAGKAGRGRSE